ncbi:Alpha-amylase-related protein [Gryllus bimaculatus]|nr:Alpha-amylase-related protein [Gryllus bimaculatus]
MMPALLLTAAANILDVTINSDNTCGNGWVCEHRWRQTLTAWLLQEHRTSVTNWWDNGNQQIAFGRGNAGFIAFNDQYNTDLKQTLQTGLSQGTYCDVISGSKSNGACSGKSVTVNGDGTAYIEILSSEDDGVLAIHSGSKLRGRNCAQPPLSRSPSAVMRALLLLLPALAAVAVAQKDPHWVDGRNTIVHLFEWKFSDIAAECERFLGPRGYAGVQTSPVNEYLALPNNNPSRPWWERYQPISYQIISRSGNEAEFADMVRRCNNVGVRIYVDVVINHMAANWPDATGYGGNKADTYNKNYPAVSYGSGNFHSTCQITNYNDANNVRNCELSGLHDLDQSQSYVREKIIDFLNALVDHAGTEAVHNYEYTSFGVVTEFRYGKELSNCFKGNNAIKWLVNWGPQWGLLPSSDALAFIDNHDNQRGHGGGGDVLTYKTPKLYKMAIAFMLSWPYGVTRVMSSFTFSNNDAGPPANGDGSIKDVTINSDGTCGNGWECEHRWNEISNMVAFRNTVQGTSVTNWWDNDSQQIAYSRGNRGFIAFNDQYNTDLKQTLQTGLSQGTYCDLASGSKVNGSCTGKRVTVNGDGTAYIEILSSGTDGFLAISADQKDPHWVEGRNTIVQMFEWKFSDIAAECERFLAPAGYAGVQTSPVNECPDMKNNNPSRPWWERYQPMSYKIVGRSGTEQEFADMVRRCNNVGVRIYIDVVFNHMTGNVQNPIGYGGDTADPQNKYYPAVRNCELSGLHDLDQSQPYVREKIIEFLNSLVSHGVAGFRVDAAKHMWPADLEYIYSQVDDLSTEFFPSNSRPFVYQEVIDHGGEPIHSYDYTSFGVSTEFKYGSMLSDCFKGNNDIHWLKNWGTGWGLLDSSSALAFIDNHDTQRDGDVLTYKTPKLYKMAVAFMLSWPYGITRITSSYAFTDRDVGPPADSDGNILDVTINSDSTCGNGTAVENWWDNGKQQIAFSRGNSGFMAFNDQYNTDFKETLQTGLPQGVYCDLASGSLSNGSCSGKSVTVNSDGTAYVEILDSEQDGFLAISSAEHKVRKNLKLSELGPMMI